MSYVSYKKVIDANRKKTYIVLGIYLLIYAFIGLLVDVILYDNGYLMETIKKLVTFQLFPIFTLSLFVFGIISIFISIALFSRIQLAGEDYLEITPDNKDFKFLYNILEELKISARMKYMPKLYVIEADYMNAFASGWNEKNTMIAITTGLLNKLNREELAAVLGHELTHIRNEDVKLTLIIGVTTNLMLFVVDWIVLMFLNGNSDGAKKAKMILMILHFVLPLLTVVLQMWLSRSREYMADSGAVELIRNPKAMASALEKISGDYIDNSYKDTNVTRKAAYIFEPGDSIFSTHPAIKNRIKKLIGN